MRDENGFGISCWLTVELELHRNWRLWHMCGACVLLCGVHGWACERVYGWMDMLRCARNYFLEFDLALDTASFLLLLLSKESVILPFCRVRLDGWKSRLSGWVLSLSLDLGWLLQTVVLHLQGRVQGLTEDGPGMGPKFGELEWLVGWLVGQTWALGVIIIGDACILTVSGMQRLCRRKEPHLPLSPVGGSFEANKSLRLRISLIWWACMLLPCEGPISLIS